MGIFTGIESAPPREWAEVPVQRGPFEVNAPAEDISLGVSPNPNLSNLDTS